MAIGVLIGQVSWKIVEGFSEVVDMSVGGFHIEHCRRIEHSKVSFGFLFGLEELSVLDKFLEVKRETILGFVRG